MAVTAEVTGVVLAGGLGTRAGAPKATIPLEGETLLARAVRRLGGWFPVVLASVRTPNDPVPPPAVGVADDPAGGGPLVALATVLARCDTPWAFVAACDLPDLDADTVAFLVRSAQATPDMDVVVPLDPSGRPQWLHAVYRTAVAPALRGAVARRERALHRALATLGVRHLAPAEWAHLPRAAASFAGLNTAAAIAARQAAGGSTAAPAEGPAAPAEGPADCHRGDAA